MQATLSPFRKLSTGGLLKSLKRFWPALLAGLLAASCFIIATELTNQLYTEPPFWLIKLAFSAVFLLFTCIAVGLKPGLSAIKGYLLALVLSVGLFFLLPQQQSPFLWYKLALILPAALLAIFLAPYPPSAGYWQRAYSTGVALLIATLYGGFVFLALALAMASVDALFDISIPSKSYFEVWIVDVLVLIPWLALALLPSQLQHGEPIKQLKTAYPRVLQLFANYVLVPVALLYLVILYAYGIKILVQFDWPRGWVAAPVLGLSALSLIFYALTAPLSALALSIGARWYRRGFWWAILPLLILLGLSLWRRINDYGLTEERLLVVGFGLWILVLAIKGIRKPVPGLRWLLSSLIITALSLAIIAPPLAIQDQSRRFAAILEETNTILPATAATSKQLSLKQLQDLSSISLYLSRRNSLDALEDMVPAEVIAQPDSINEWDRPRMFMTALGLRYVESWEKELTQQEEPFRFAAKASELIDIRDYRQMVPLEYSTYILENAPGIFKADYSNKQTLSVTGRGRHYNFALDSMLRQHRLEMINHQELRARDLTLYDTTGKDAGKLIIRHLSGSTKEDSITVEFLSGFLLIK